MPVNNNLIREYILEAFEESLEAQLRAVRRLKTGQKEVVLSSDKGMSQVDLAYDILIKAGEPLHVTEIINRIQNTHHVQVDRESLVSALTKKIKRADRFSKTGKNTFKAN